MMQTSTRQSRAEPAAWAFYRQRLLPGDQVQLKGGGPVMTVHAKEEGLVRCVYRRGSRTRLFLMPANFLNIVDGDQRKGTTQLDMGDDDGKQEEQEQHSIDYRTH